MPDPLSEGEIAVFVSQLCEGTCNTEGATKLLNEIGRRLQFGEAIDGTRLAEYLAWATRRFQITGDANSAFGLTGEEHRPKKNAERDSMIAFLVEKARARNPSVIAACASVSEYLAQSNPPIDLSAEHIKKLYQANRNNPLILAAKR
jgi:hypothetical protein